MKNSARDISKPSWLKKKLPLGERVTRLERLVERHGLHTVCHGAKCPNRNDCFHEGCATFLILGDRCTRGCRFCSIPKGPLGPPDPEEPRRLALAVEEMMLTYAVITSVTRDDLPDGGAAHFAAVTRALKRRIPKILVELLVPDFRGSEAALAIVLESGLAVLNHNIETVPSLYPEVRPGADYGRSLGLLASAAARGGVPVKSGLMVGLGETPEEVVSTLRDLRRSGVDLVTIGQYLQPAPDLLCVKEYIEPAAFEAYAAAAQSLGFKGIAAGPFVRSSHHAQDLYGQYCRKADVS